MAVVAELAAVGGPAWLERHEFSGAPGAPLVPHNVALPLPASEGGSEPV